MKDDIGRIMDKVRALFAKAESTDYEPEADALNAKAQELITRYALDAAALLQDSDSGPAEVVVRTVTVPGPYQRARTTLLGNVGKANCCYVAWTPRVKNATIAGTEANITVALALWQSLMTQGDRMLLQQTPVGNTRSYRASWWYSYASRVGARLHRTQREVAGDLLPVLVSERDRAEALIREQFSMRASSTSIRNAHGWSAGRSAADRADVGNPSFGGRKALTR